MKRATFVLPGIGRVTQRKGETRARAEKRARIQHGRKSSGKSFVVLGIGRVSKRKGETAKQAQERARKEHAVISRVRSVVVFDGAAESIDFITFDLPELDLPERGKTLTLVFGRLDPSGLPIGKTMTRKIDVEEETDLNEVIQSQARSLYKKNTGAAIITEVRVTVPRDEFDE